MTIYTSTEEQFRINDWFDRVALVIFWAREFWAWRKQVPNA